MVQFLKCAECAAQSNTFRLRKWTMKFFLATSSHLKWQLKKFKNPSRWAKSILLTGKNGSQIKWNCKGEGCNWGSRNEKAKQRSRGRNELKQEKKAHHDALGKNEGSSYDQPCQKRGAQLFGLCWITEDQVLFSGKCTASVKDTNTNPTILANVLVVCCKPASSMRTINPWCSSKHRVAWEQTQNWDHELCSNFKWKFETFRSVAPKWFSLNDPSTICRRIFEFHLCFAEELNSSPIWRRVWNSSSNETGWVKTHITFVCQPFLAMCLLDEWWPSLWAFEWQLSLNAWTNKQQRRHAHFDHHHLTKSVILRMTDGKWQWCDFTCDSNHEWKSCPEF